MQFHEHKSPITYRADIDGLRALAVIPVLLFHLGLGVPGGYVGVDIFFVISGYLITSIIMKDLAKDQFSMPRFWERRIRRIVPAAAVMVAVTFVLAAVFLYPRNFTSFGKEMIAQALLSANFYFWKQHGYFAIDAGVLPLLHTWSLAIEEQFYLLFPLLLIYLRKKQSTRVLSWALALMVVSFVWTIYGVSAYPKATFYLLPSRAWELLMGSVLALYQFKRSPSRMLVEVLSWLGGAMMLGAMFFYDETTTFPGPAALLPCLGASLIIFSNHRHRSSASKLLSLKPFVFIGKISYSLYLWHWPLIVFMNYVYFYEPTLAMRLGVGALSIVLAILSWRYVENPFREKSVCKDRASLFKAFYITTAVFVVLGCAAYFSKGAPFRFSKEVIACAKLAKEHPKPKDADDLFTTGELHVLSADPAIQRTAPLLLWGDSHAQAMIPLMQDLCHDYNLNVYLATMPGNAPMLGVGFGPGGDLVGFNAGVMKFIENKKIQEVIFVARWSLYTKGNPWEKDNVYLYDPKDRSRSPEDVFEEAFLKTMAQLNDLGVKVWIMKEVPMQRMSVPIVMANCMRFNIQMKGLGVTLKEHEIRTAFSSHLIDSVKSERVTVLEPLPYLLSEDDICKVGDGKNPYYRDKNHLSEFGAKLLRPLFDPLFKSISASLPDPETKKSQEDQLKKDR